MLPTFQVIYSPQATARRLNFEAKKISESYAVHADLEGRYVISNRGKELLVTRDEQMVQVMLDRVRVARNFNVR